MRKRVGSGGPGRARTDRSGRGNRRWASRAALCAALFAAAFWGGGPSAAAAPEVPEGAKAGAAPDGPNRDDFRAELSLLFGAEQARPGERVRVGVLFELDPDWHIYWRNPGDSGLPTELQWQLAGASVGPMIWPAPETFREGELTTYGYADQVLLMGELELGAELPAGPLPVAVKADFLICKRLCIPGQARLTRNLQIGPESLPAQAETAELFEEFGARVPVAAAELGLELEGVYSQSAIRPSDAFRAALAVVPRDGAQALRPARSGIGTFWPDALPGADVRASGTRPHPTQSGGFLVTLEGKALADEAPPGADRLRGVVGVEVAGAVRYAEVDVAFPRAAAGSPVTPAPEDWFTPASAAAASGGLPLWRALLFGLAGGLILNLMPCVLPVLAIKVVRVAELAHAGRSAVLAQGAAYTSGILASMWVLALGVIALRAAGTSVGWGFQFQEPRFVVAVSAILVLFALNLFGVFDIDATPSGAGAALGHGGPLRRSFFEGLLAVVLATPCSAPFLGTAIGFAFAGSGAHIAAIFSAIGLGLAAPFVAVTLVPGWARFIPRAGAWMEHLRTLLGFTLLATVVWLLWLLGGVAGTDGLVVLVAFLIALGFAAWLFGLAQRTDRRVLAGTGALLLAGCAASGVAWLPLGAAPAPGSAGATPARAAIEGEQPFAQAAVSAALAQGRPVFVFFTADWCLTCKVNERLVLATESVRAELASLGIATFKGDWTRRDEVIRAELERHGRAGVPMYLVYRPDAPEQPRVLPELLTAETLLASLRWAAQGERAAGAQSAGKSREQAQAAVLGMEGSL